MKARPQRLDPIALVTNDSDKEFVLSELDLSGDGLTARLRVRSHGFAAEKDLRVDNFASVVAGLRGMSSAIAGEVRWGAAYEEDEVVFAMNERGQLIVHGRLVQYRDDVHRLEFEFRTDQTALGPFVADLEAFLRSAQ